MHIVTFFILVYLIKYLGNWGLLVVMIPITLGFSFGVWHFEELEKKTENYPKNNLPMSPNDLAAGLISR